MVFQHVVFDLDGTLVDSREDLVAAVNHALRSLGRPAQDAHQVLGYVGDGARRLIERSLGAAENAADVAAGVTAFLDYYAAHLLDATRAYPGILETLAALSDRGVTLSVLTNKPAGPSRRILAGLGLASRFHAIVGGDTLSTRKPDPEGLAHLCDEARVPVAQTLLVGDSPVDVRTARAAGAAVCGVTWGLAPEGLSVERPDWLIDQPAALVAIALGSSS